MPLALNVLKDEINGLHYTSCYLAQGAGGGEVQFQVTLHGVQLVTHSRRSLQDMSTGTLRGWIYFQKKPRTKLIPEFEWKGLMLITQGSGELLVLGGLATWSLQFYCSITLSCLFL